MSLEKDFFSHPALIEEGARFVSDETTDAANWNDLINRHRCLQT